MRALFYVTVSGGCEMCAATERLLKTAKKPLQESRNGQKNNVWQPTAENNKISVNKNNKNKDQGQDYNRNVARSKAKHTVSCTMGKGKELKCARYDADRPNVRCSATIGCDTF